MRGKKVDTEFLSDFIQGCVSAGIDSTDGFVEKAKKDIETIDSQIKAMEKKKILRCKLLGVISSFEKTSKPSKCDEAKILTFFKLSHPDICENICKVIDHKGIFSDIVVGNRLDTAFSIKQLLEHKILHKVGNNFVAGLEFDSYIRFLNKDK